MTHWIYELRRERDEEQQRQKHFASVFPTLAEALWGQLCNTVQDDLQRMKELFPELLSGKTQISRQPNSLRVDYVDLLPHYFLGVTVNIPEQTITLHQIVLSPDACPVNFLESGPDTILTLSLNEKQQRVQLSLHGQIFSPEKFSELCLGPIVSLHPIEIMKVVSDRAA